MDTMLILQLTLLLVVLHHSTSSDPTKLVHQSSTRIKREFTDIGYGTFQRPFIRISNKHIPSVIKSLNQDDLLNTGSVQFKSSSSIDPNAVKMNNSRPNTSFIINSRLPYLYNGRTNPIGSHLSTNQDNLRILRESDKPSAQQRGYEYPNSNAPRSQESVSYAPIFDNFDFGAFQFDASEFPILSSLNQNPIESFLPIIPQNEPNPTHEMKHQKTKEASSKKASQNGSRMTSSVPLNINEGVSLPLVQFQSTHDFPMITHALNKQPVLLNVGSNPQLQMKQYFPAGRNLGNTEYFSASTGNPLQGHIVPVQSASSTPELPRFKGANIDSYSSDKYNKVVKLPNAYQALIDQPQLHFDPNIWSPANIPETTSYYFKPAEEIRTDVEIINKKKPPPPAPAPDDDDDDNNDGENDDDDDEGFKFFDKEYEKNADDEEDYSGKFTKEKESEENVKKPYAFHLYDEKFGKYSKKVKNGNKEVKPTPSFMDYSSNDDYGDTDKYSSKYHNNYSPVVDTFENFEDKSKEEAQVNKKLQAKNKGNGYRVTTVAPNESYEADFNTEYQRSHEKKKIPKRKTKFEIYNMSEHSLHSEENTDKVSKIPRYNYQEKPNLHVPHSLEHFSKRDGNSPRKNKKQHLISSKRNLDVNVNEDKNKTFSQPINEKSFGYKIPRLQSTLKPINHHTNSQIHTNSKSPMKQDIHTSPSIHKSNISRNENRPLHQMGNSYSVYTENKRPSNKRSQTNTNSNPDPLLRAFSDVYSSWKPSFYLTRDKNFHHLMGI